MTLWSDHGGDAASLSGRTCLCQSPLMTQISRRLSRRALVGGLCGTAAVALSGVPKAALAAADTRPILLTNARLFDGRSNGLRGGTNVLVAGNAIRALPPVSEQVADSRTVDCGGRVIMPGLIDAHWHAILAAVSLATAMTADVPYLHLVAAREAEQTLLRGFTSVRDVGGPSFALKRAIDEGVVAGPRIFPSGAMISQTSGHGDFRLRGEIPRTPASSLSAAEAEGATAIADGVDEMLRRVREQLLLGASQIKLMTGGGVTSSFDPIDSLQFTEPEIRAAVAAASDWGTYVCTHVYTADGIRRALDCGVKCIEHGQLADEDAVRRIAGSGAWWSLQPFLLDEDANTMPTPRQRADQRTVAEGTARAYAMAQHHNANVAWGTDILFSPGKTGTQGRQLAKVARWFADVDVLKMATSRNAELLALSGKRNPYPGALGVIEAGALADLIVLDGDPTADINLIADPNRNMKLIMKDGRIHKNTL